MSSNENLAKDDQCGYCSEFGECRIDPRVLPCGHSCCLPCITADFKRTMTVTCPSCRARVKTDKSLAELPLAAPSAQKESESSAVCYTCSGTFSSESMSALMHCNQCSKGFCGEHLALHSQLFYDHQIEPVGRRGDNSPLNGFTCVQHTKYLYIVGCLLCDRLYCNMCLLTNPNFCFKAMEGTTTHRYGTIEIVVSGRGRVRSSIQKLEYRFRCLNDLASDGNKVLKLIDEHQQKCMGEVEQTFQRQVEELKNQYSIVRNRLSKATSAAKDKSLQAMSQVDVELQNVDEVLVQLRDCLNAENLSDFLQQRGPFVEKANSILANDLLKLDDFSLLDVKVNERTDVKAEVKLLETSLIELAPRHDLGTLPLAPISMTSHQAPNKLHYCRSLLLYKSNVPSPRVLFCTHQKAFYSLTKSFICRYHPSLLSTKNIGTHADEGQFIKEFEGKIYTRQLNGSELVNIYPLQDNLVLPKIRKQQVKYDGELLLSFALVREEIVFCENCEYPRLIIFPASADVPPRILELQFGASVQRPIFIGDGPKGHITLICKEWIELQTKSEELRLISLADGATVWKHTLTMPINLEAFPEPVIYHNGFLLLFVGSTMIRVLSPKTGQVLRSITMKSTNDNTEYIIKHTSCSQLCSYSDNELLLFEHQRVHVTKNPSATQYAINLSLFEISTEECFV